MAMKPVPWLWVLEANRRFSQLEKPKMAINCVTGAKFISLSRAFDWSFV